MDEVIKPNVKSIYNKLKDEGHKVYFVGGCVRDFLMGVKIKDWDMTTSATPEEIQQIFPNSFYDNKFGTVGVPFETENEDDKNFAEVTTFRFDGNYSNSRHPEEVTWGKSIEEDLSRRDFSVNAIAADINGNTTTYVDPYEGQIDISKKILRTVGDPDARFAEDALRILRAIRFTSQLGFEIEEKTWESLKRNAELITKISGERIRDEILRILETERAYEGIVMLDKAGLLDIIFPELAIGKGVDQKRPGRHHTSDVFTHNIESLHHTTSTDPVVRLATLLHDVGKPYVKNTDSDGHVIFYNHEVKGAQIASTIADRLRLSKKQKEKIVTLIRWHMFTVDENITDSAVRRFIRRVGLDNVADMMDLRIGDRLGGGTQVAESWRLKNFKERVTSELNPPFSINDLAIDGNDIMKELNLTPGPKVGEILKTLFEEVDEDLTKNTVEYLKERIKQINKS